MRNKEEEGREGGGGEKGGKGEERRIYLDVAHIPDIKVNGFERSIIQLFMNRSAGSAY